MPVCAALFDFDGTLADSFAAITASTNHVRASHGLPALREDEVRSFVGYGLPHLLEHLVPNAPVDAAVALYRDHHQGVIDTHTSLLPGVAHTIAELARRGYRMAVCSNKRVEFTRKLIGSLGLAQYFAAVLGPDDVGDRAKPDPAMLIEGLARVGASPNEAVYVGDMAIDVRTAKAAGVPVWLVLGGAAGLEDATASGPDRVLNAFTEILDLLPALASHS